MTCCLRGKTVAAMSVNESTDIDDGMPFFKKKTSWVSLIGGLIFVMGEKKRYEERRGHQSTELKSRERSAKQGNKIMLSWKQLIS